MLVTKRKYIAGITLICGSVFIGGCGGIEDPADSLIKWKVEGRYDLQYMTDQGATYSIQSPDNVNFTLTKTSPIGAVDWVKNLDLINTYNEVGLATLYLQSGDDGTNRLVVYTSDYKAPTGGASASNDYHILVLDENGTVTNEIRKEGETFPDGNYNYAIDKEIPGLIIRYKNHDLDLITENTTTSIAMPASVSGYAIRNVRHTLNGVVAFMRHESDNTQADKLAYISLTGDIHWIEDAPELVTASSEPQALTYFVRNIKDGGCEYTLHPFNETGFQPSSTFTCSEDERTIFSQTKIIEDDIHFFKDAKEKLKQLKNHLKD